MKIFRRLFKGVYEVLWQESYDKDREERAMKVFCCNKYFNKSKADVFQSISREDLQSLHIEAQERQGVFRPITTDLRLPIKAALIALNGYVKEDFLEFFEFPTPMVEACRTHKPLKERLPIVTEKYRSGVPALAEAAFYFTNFVKIYPPESKFKRAAQMDSFLKRHPRLITLFRQYLKDEIVGLMKDGCRVFICFGIEASHYFIETVQSDTDNECELYKKIDGADNNVKNTVYVCKINGERVLIVSDRHYAYFHHSVTDYLASVLAESY